MNFSSFIFKILIIKLISFSIEFQFNPIPEGNGKLNSEYNHKSEENNLFFIFLSFRHGARASLYLIDDYNDMLGGNWPVKGELTKLGKRQLYEIGLRNRKRYSNFICKEYDPKEVLIYSTNYDRSIMSAQQQLLGLFNNITYPNINFTDFPNNDFENINQIIPPINLFTVNENNNIKENKFENLFKGIFDCRYSRELYEKNWDKPNSIMINMLNDFLKEYYKILKKEFKDINRKKIKTIRGFDKFCDCFISIYNEESHKYILDKFTRNGKNITRIKEICDNYLYNIFLYIRNGGYATNNYLISISPVIRKVIDWMFLRLNKNNNFLAEYGKPKFVLFSGHDSSLSEMQHFLNVAFNIDYEYTEYGSTQLFELRKYGNLFYVEVYYNDKLKMNITFEEFKNRAENISMSDKEIFNICYRKKRESYIFYLKILLSFILIILLIVIGYLVMRTYNIIYMEKNITTAIQIE